MMNKATNKSRTALAFAGITAGLLALFGVSAQASTPRAHNHATDCKIVAAADRALCKRVQTFHSYGSYNGNEHAYWSVDSGIVNVHELTHDGLSKAEMHAALVGYDKEYAAYVTHVSVNMDSMVAKCGNTDGRWVISYRDEDGRPGGTKLTYKRIVCP
jgi:hypothetical protein